MKGLIKQLEKLVFERHGNTVDKWEQCFGVYACEQVPFFAANQPVWLLELGAQIGGLQELLAKYLPAGATRKDIPEWRLLTGIESAVSLSAIPL